MDWGQLTMKPLEIRFELELPVRDLETTCTGEAQEYM